MKYLGAQMLEFSQRGDERGHLVVVEGQHANRKTEFVLINVAG